MNILVASVIFFTILPTFITANYQSKLWPIPQSIEWGSYNLELDVNAHIYKCYHPILTQL